WVRMEFVVPSRGLIGFRTEFLTQTRGTGIAHSIHEGHEPWFGTLQTRNSGSLVADRAGAVTAFAMTNLQERGVLFVEPGTEVYEGMIVGENSRSDDMDANITKEKKLTNMRSSTADVTESIVPPRKLSLQQSLEFCRDDECAEVTPEPIRIRTVNLSAGQDSRSDDMAVNTTKEKKLTNARSATADVTESIVPPRKLSLEQSLGFCRDDECVEVTPESIRIRKVNLDARERARAASRAKHG